MPNITMEFNKISASLYKKYSTLKVSNSSNYLEELFDIEGTPETERFKFQVTATSTQELIMLPQRCVWGIDSRGVIHNLKRYEEFPQLCLQPKIITKGKYIWFRDITKPLETPLSVKSIQDDLMFYWFTFLYIDYVWELYKIDPVYNGKTSEWV